MKKIIAVLVLLSLTGCEVNEEAIKKSDYSSYAEYWYDKTLAESGSAVAEVESLEFDFDTLPPNIQSSHRFKVKNTGTNPLKFIAGPKSCKCTKIELVNREIAPGETGEIELVWKTVGGASEFSHTGSVYTNDPHNRRLRFRVKGKVIREVAMTPGVFNFQRVHPDSKKSTVDVLIFSEAWNQIEIKDVKTTFGDQAEVEILPVTDDQREARSGILSGKNIRLTLKTPEKPGPIRGIVSFKIVGPDKEAEHQIDVRGKVLRRLSLEETNAGVLTMDSVVHMGRIQSLRGHREKFLLTVNDDNKKLSITKVSATPDFVDVEMRPLNKKVDKHGVYVLEIVVPPGQDQVNFNRAGKFGKLKIEFDHPRVAPFDLGLDFFVID